MHAKKARPEIPLDLDIPRIACFNARAMNFLESEAETENQSLPESEKKPAQIWKMFDWTHLTNRDVTRILHASLQSDAEAQKAPITYKNLEDWLTVDQILGAMETILLIVEELIDRAMPVLESDEVNERIERLQKKTEKMKKARKAQAEKQSKKTAASTGSSS